MAKWMLALASVLAMSGCTVTRARMAMPEGFQADGEGYAVKGSAFRTGRTPVSFGPYRASEITGWAFPSRWTISGKHLGFGQESLRYGFAMQEGGVPGEQARCSAEHWFVQLLGTHNGDGFSIESPVRPDSLVLACNFGEASLTLWTKRRDVVGDYDIAGGMVRVESVRRIEGVAMNMGAPLGYRFLRDGRDLMTVDLLAPGRVTFAKGLDADTRRQLAMAAAALLMLAPE